MGKRRSRSESKNSVESSVLEKSGEFSHDDSEDFNMVEERHSKSWKTVDTSSIFSHATAGIEGPKNEVDFSGIVSVQTLDPSEWLGLEHNTIQPKKKRKKKTKHDTSRDLKSKKVERINEEIDIPRKDDPSILDAWEPFGIHEDVLKGIQDLKFSSPTPIQERCLPAAIKHRKNIIAAAQTGSGKTLAFGIPVLDRLLFLRHRVDSENTDIYHRRLFALILTPTRELALQVTDHIKSVAKYCDIGIMSIVGGMAAAKQDRLLTKNRPEIIVATPGRLWDLMKSDYEHLSDFSMLNFLIVDEADRMILEGHFRELSFIFDFLNKKTNELTDKPKRQTFLFSATLEVENAKGASIDLLCQKMNLSKDGKDRKQTVIVDLTPETRIANTVTEAYFQCVKEDKDSYLYYFLSFYPGRTLVFVNAIGTCKRLISLLTLLKIQVWGLHAKMQQRQRLKNLDRFKMSDKAVLVCSDVAARGLDIPEVDHVLHYEVPRTSENYVHRSGRTGRAGCRGFTLSFVGSHEQLSFKKITQEIGKKIPLFPCQLSYLRPLDKRVQLAAKLEKELNSTSKEQKETNWYLKNAKELDIELDEEVWKTVAKHDSKKRGAASTDVSKMKADLAALLAEPVVPMTSKSRQFVTINQELHGTLDFNVSDVQASVASLYPLLPTE